MRALVISHDPTERAAVVGARLEHHGFRLDEFVVCDAIDRPESQRPFPSLDGVDVVVAMGAPWSVYDEDTIGSWIGRELSFVREVHERAIPYLGVCFGAQVLSAALGGRVERAPRPELGWCLVGSDAAALADGPWFQWHGDRFSLPPGADALARNEVGVQAFRVGRSVGVQFHPEVDVDLMASWLLDGEPPDPLFVELGVTVDDIMTATAAHQQTSAHNAQRLVDWFLSLGSWEAAA